MQGIKYLDIMLSDGVHPIFSGEDIELFVMDDDYLVVKRTNGKKYHYNTKYIKYYIVTEEIVPTTPKAGCVLLKEDCRKMGEQND